MRRSGNWGWWLALFWLINLPKLALGQSSAPHLIETRHYAIEVAGIRVGTMTATSEPQQGNDLVYTLTSDVKVNFLIYNLKIYYQVINRFRGGILLLSTVEAHTNQGNFASRAEWKGDHYDILADQYKHHYRATEKSSVTYTVTNLFFGEPATQTQAFAEYFGDYFHLSPGSNHTYRASRDGREDEYHYSNGQLVTIIKKNPLKNFIIRLLPYFKLKTRSD